MQQLTLKKALCNIKLEKRYYFMWKHGMKTWARDYSTITEEQFKEKYCKGSEIKYKNLQDWEKTEEYQNLLNLKMAEGMTADIFKIYNVVKDKALEGDDKAIKTLLMLQKEVKKNLKNIDKVKVEDEVEIEEDDGLEIE
ncbi:hypothetical protein [Clostridium tyrobutyricum]|jgi:hypothetical protein|uniref:hypothetical protein n=1 Tax=Clostridium tyrobutyricum TaxID=1519 RepID=UPI000E953BC5|nr:hypothetical protein [Clostridium tyrobutyricum]HBN28380.1 hypothetical protein [Clostridiaceae bacterium]